MTYLEFVCRRLRGPPSGVSFPAWPYPYCEHPRPSLSVRRRPSGKTKYNCFRCKAFGDEFDLIWRFRPRSDYGDRLVVARELRQEWEEAEASTPSPTGSTDRVRRTALEWADLTDELRAEGVDEADFFRRLGAMYEAGYFRDYGRRVGDVLVYWEAFLEWITATNAAHLSACSNPACDWYCCRALRGLPPLTREEAAEQNATEAEERRQRLERCFRFPISTGANGRPR